MWLLNLYWTCCGDATYGFMSIYIFYARGCAFVVSICESFYYAVGCKCLCDVLLHYVCIFRHDYALCYGICRGSMVALVFFPLALLGWGGAGTGVVVGLCRPGGG